MLKSLSVRVKRKIKTVPTLQGVCFVVFFFFFLFVFVNGKFFLFPLELQTWKVINSRRYLLYLLVIKVALKHRGGRGIKPPNLCSYESP